MKTLLEKKVLYTSIFSFSRNVFYPIILFSYLLITPVFLTTALNFYRSSRIRSILWKSFFIATNQISLVLLTHSQTSPGFYMSAVQVHWKDWEKKKLLVMSNFSFSQCFQPVKRTSCHVHKFFSHSAFNQFRELTTCHFYQIWNCRLQTLSVWRGLKFVVWERVNLLLKGTVELRFIVTMERLFI